MQEGRLAQNLLGELGFTLGLRLRTDSSVATQVAEKVRQKPMQLRYMFLNDLVRTSIVVIEEVSGERRPADMLTKPVPWTTLERCLRVAESWQIKQELKV